MGKPRGTSAGLPAERSEPAEQLDDEPKDDYNEGGDDHDTDKDEEEHQCQDAGAGVSYQIGSQYSGDSAARAYCRYQ